MSGYGDILRDNQCTLLVVGLGGLGITTSYEVEIEAIIQGIIYAIEMGVENI